jgi:RNA polymerase sigma-70 factor (ECF subfamily)
MNSTNETWLQRLLATGSVRDDALAELREVLMLRLRRTFQGRTGVDEALLEDVAQEALLKTLEKLDQFEGRSRFTTWATTIAVRVAFTELRRRRWKDVSLDQMLENESGGVGQTVDTHAGPQDEAQQQALVKEMYRIIDTELTEKQRTALLAEFKGMPQEEIGRRMGSNRNAVYKLTHDGRKRLKQGLEQAGFTAADLGAV